MKRTNLSGFPSLPPSLSTSLPCLELWNPNSGEVVPRRIGAWSVSSWKKWGSVLGLYVPVIHLIYNILDLDPLWAFCFANGGNIIDDVFSFIGTWIFFNHRICTIIVLLIIDKKIWLLQICSVWFMVFSVLSTARVLQIELIHNNYYLIKRF